MFNWLRKVPAEPLAVSMASLKLGDKLLVIGCADPKLIAALAAKVGLTGRACAVDEDEALSAAAGTFAEREGVLIETMTFRGSLPYPADSFDVVVVREMSAASLEKGARLQEARRVLRPGGRCVVVEGVERSGVRSLLAPGQGSGNSELIATRALDAASFVAVRTIAQRAGMLFVEGVKRNL
jgi:ubiquinone/menaquinone biosynthesis C-methylase UbiE